MDRVRKHVEKGEQVLMLVNIRLGIRGVTKEYFSAIKRYMKLPSFAGLVGG